MVRPWLAIRNFCGCLPLAIGDNKMDRIGANGQERDESAAIVGRKHEVSFIVNRSLHSGVQLVACSDLGNRMDVPPTNGVESIINKNDIGLAIELRMTENRIHEP